MQPITLHRLVAEPNLKYLAQELGDSDDDDVDDDDDDDNENM
jgi:hypothetical protein